MLLRMNTTYIRAKSQRFARVPVRSIANRVRHSLQCLISSLSRILMLLVRFALPTSDTVVAENIDDLVSDLNLCTNADEFGRSSPFADDILEGVDELFIGFKLLFLCM